MNDFELIPTVKGETMHPVEGFSNEFPSIYNHCGVMTISSRKTLKKVSIFAFFGKTTPYGKIFKILFRKNLSLHRSTCCVQISWNLADGKSVKSCVAYLSKRQNFAWFSSSRYCTDRSQNLPRPASDNVLRVLEISSKSVHFWRRDVLYPNAWTPSERARKWIQYSAEVYLPAE